MKYYASIVLIIITFSIGHSQTYEFGGFIGGANFIGDVGKTTYLAPNNLAIGGILKWNRSQRHSFRASFIVAGLQGNDQDSSEERRKQRGYSFENTITETSIGIEYTFWEFNMYNGRPQSTPYLYTGLTYMTYDALFKRADDQIVAYDGAGTVAIPMVIGLKSFIGGGMVLGFEAGARYTFTDNIDGSFPTKGLADTESLRFGNTNSDDWYVFTGVTVTFAFGRKPCYCNF